MNHGLAQIFKSSVLASPGFGELRCGGLHDNYREPVDDGLLVADSTIPLSGAL
jgi:hypothetical protein